MISKLANNRLLKTVVTVVGQVLMGVALYLLATQLMRNWEQIASDLVNMQIGFLAAALFLTLVMLLMMALGWTLALQATGVQITLRTGFIIYYRTSILRYLPGSVWNFPGRAYLCQKQGIAISAFAQSTFLELFFLLATCGVWAGWGMANYFGSPFPLILSAVAAGAILTVIKWHRFVLSAIGRIAFMPPIKNRHTLLSILLVYTLIWVIYGEAIVLLLQAMPGIRPPPILLAIATNSAAWAAGFLSLSPFGLGVRELGLAVMLGPELSMAAILASLVLRCMEIGFEGLLWITARACAIQ
jgi:uncharacterized membrane protein YbhN (UPF0104 family)